MRNSVGNEGGGGRQRACLQIIVLIRVKRPRDKRISCKGQVAGRGAILISASPAGGPGCFVL